MVAAHKIAVIPGDGIGKEVMPEGLRVLEAAGRRFGIELGFTSFDWSCQRYERHGRMMPEDGLERLRGFEAIYLGAVGWPSVPGTMSRCGACACRSARASTSTPTSGPPGFFQGFLPC